MTGKLFQLLDGDGELVGLYFVKDERITDDQVKAWYDDTKKPIPKAANAE